MWYCRKALLLWYPGRMHDHNKRTLWLWKWIFPRGSHSLFTGMKRNVILLISVWLSYLLSSFNVIRKNVILSCMLILSITYNNMSALFYWLTGKVYCWSVWYAAVYEQRWTRSVLQILNISVSSFGVRKTEYFA